MKKKEQIKRAYTSGNTDTKQLAERYGTKEKYVKKVIREAALREEDKPVLTVASYIETVRMNLTTVEDLAYFFNVSKRTIQYFHAKNLVRTRLSEYLYVLNKPKRQLGRVDYTELHTLSEVCNLLNEICNTITPLAADYKPAAKNIKRLRKIIAEIEQIKP